MDKEKQNEKSFPRIKAHTRSYIINQRWVFVQSEELCLSMIEIAVLGRIVGCD